jgi:transcriptional regulator with GAF, ATPase, and Fis domain
MIAALADLRARAIGVDVVFEDRRMEYPEYDELLASVARSAGTVVLPVYFDRLIENAPGADTADGVMLTAVPWAGRGAHLPYEALREAVPSLGHAHLEGGVRVPLVVEWAGELMPPFALEVVRKFLDGKVWLEADRVSIRGSDREVSFGARDWTVDLLHPGPLSSYRSYPFLEVLRSYDALRGDRTPGFPVQLLRDKIVLVGVIAEGRSQFVDTPVDAALPSILLHAAFIDNVLQRRFLSTVPAMGVAAIALATAILAAVALLGAWPRAGLIVLLVALALTALSFVLFSAAAVQLPLTVPLLATALAATGASVMRRQADRRRVRALEREHEEILGQLRDREAKLAVLERSLAARSIDDAPDRASALLEELQRTRAEIRTLSSQAGDMEPYAAAEDAAPDLRARLDDLVYARGGTMRPVVEMVEKIAANAAPVLILGESGTGKELIARAIHRRSGRHDGPFVAVNCGALAETLLESELFGHERGAFTGAVKERVGRFELANGGTIFLDEIGEVSEAFQVKLLRVLQQGEFERVGGSATLTADVRVLAATNKDLKEAVRSRHFREDLYYRLNVLTVELPPLRERQGDIPVLVEHFLEQQGGGMQISRNVMEALERYSWPGNVRELESTLTRAVLLAKADRRTLISARDLGPEIAAEVRDKAPLEEQVLELVRARRFLRSAVTESAAALGGLNRGTVAEYLRGEFFRAFAEHQFSLEQAVRSLSLSVEDAVNERVRRRLLEYLSNLSEAVDRGRPWEEARAALRPKLRNLPQRYHATAERIAEGFFRGLWKLPEDPPAG